MSRVFLFLQGPMGPFFNRLGAGLVKAGDTVWKINYNVGDRYFWYNGNTIDYYKRLKNYPEFIRKVVDEKNITDLALYSDGRPLHKAAIEALKGKNVKIHVFEEGYFRPNWITLEEGGVNANSSLPKDPEFYAKWPDDRFPDSKRFSSSYKPMFWYAFLYYINTVRGMYGEFKNYKHHFNVSPHITIGKWVLKFLLRRHKPVMAKFTLKKVVQLSYFLVPLQLSRDYQIKNHSQFRDVPEFIDFVTKDFAENAGKGDNIVFKIHPLDNDPCRVERAVKKYAKKYDVAKRVFLIDGGHLPTLLDYSKGVIIANSTSGVSAIHHRRPVIALSNCIYNIAGLTFQGSLAEFWKNPTVPDKNLYKRFANYIIRKTQMNGNFYSSDGIESALSNSLNRLLAKK